MPIHNIDVATGTVAFDQTDVGIGGVLPLSFIRHYSTANLQRIGELGQGWSHNFDHRLSKTIEGWCYTDERGRQTHIVGHTPGFELVECSNGQIDLRRYNSGNPRLWMVFERIAGEYRLVELNLTPTQRLVVRRDLRSGRIFQIDHTRSGRSLKFIYENDRLKDVLVVFPDGSTEIVSKYMYENDRLKFVFDRMGLKATFEYDELGCIVFESKVSGTEYSFAYDGKLRCVHAHGVDGFEARWISYDDNSRTTTVKDRSDNAWVYTCNAFGQVLKEIKPNGALTQRLYDDKGQLISTTGPLGNIIDRSYDDFGQLIQIFDRKRKRTWTLGYDVEHRVASVRLPNGAQWRYEYDGNGLASSIGPHGHAWKYFHNDHGELVGVSDPLRGAATRTYDSNGNVTFTSAAGRMRTFEYDKWGRCIVSDGNKKRYNEAGHIDRIETKNGLVYHYKYDLGGRVVERTGPSGTWKASWIGCGCLQSIRRPNGSVVNFVWGKEPGQLKCLVDGDGKCISWEYDAVGKPTKRFHWDGRETRYEFDLAGNPVKVSNDKRTFEYLYDADNNLVKFIPDEGAPIAYEYDVLDRLASVTKGDDAITFERDHYGAIVRESSTANDKVLRRTRDALGRPTQVKIGSYSTDWNWQGPNVESIEHGPELWTIEHDVFGHEVVRTTVAGVLRQQFDIAGNVTGQVVENDGKHVFEAGYLYRDGSLVGEYRRDGEQGFGIDDVERLVHWSWSGDGASAVLSRCHDNAGNAISESLLVAEETHEHDNEVRYNRTEKVWDPYRDCIVFYDYDDRGQVVRRREPDRETTFEWSSDGLLMAVIVDGAKWSYTYDPLGRRVTKTSPDAKRWTYAWDDARILTIDGPDGRLEYVYRPYGASPIAFRARGRTWDLIPRPQGTPAVAVSDKGKAIPLHGHLDPWLRPIGEVEAKPRLGFPGQEGFLGSPGQYLDPETGLYYNVRRYYDPILGKFITPDPTGLVGGLNEYAWVPNPMAWIDPLGLNYVSGGPMPWRPGDNARNNGRPNLSDPDNRFVDVDGRDRVVKNRSENDNGKCMTVVDGVPDGALPMDRGFQPGDTPVFVSGFGNPNPTPMSTFDVRGDQMGNWCHGEIQALHFLVQQDISGATVWVDRPPCPMCAGDMDDILKTHFPGGDGRSVTVMYFDQEAGWETWDDYKKRTSPPCGG